MVTKTDICNFALARVGNSKIVNIDKPSDRGEKSCLLWYDTTRRAALQSGLFNFSVKRSILALENNKSPLFGWTYMYKLPSDCLRLLSVGDPNGFISYSVEGGYILTDEDFEGAMPIRYVADVEETSVYDPLFVKYFSTLLSVEIAGDMNKNVELRNLMEEISLFYKSIAQTFASSETKPVKINQSKFMASKRGMYVGRYKK